MKIALLTTSDSTGGAAIAAARLAEALVGLGQEVTVVTRNGRSRIPFIAERLDILARNGFNRRDLFKVSTASFGVSIADLPAVREADAVILGWINQGFLSLKEIGRSSKPMLWI
ncbi:MAG: glycosyl transferase, partial [Muribaculaceae bacterium]|nr:glycosyl transferase [Muribaculaceae bacterium]